MDYGVIDYNTQNLNKNIEEILLHRKQSQIIMSQFYKGEINNNLKNINLNKNNKELKNYYTNNLLLDDNNKVIKNKPIKNKNSFFDNQLIYVKNELPDLPQIPVEVSSVNLDRFYPIMKDPQINCIEKFIRGGENTVLQTLDNFKC